MEKLFEIQNVILSQFERQPFYNRDIFSQFTFDNAICGLVGMRGVGKTTFLLHHVLKQGAKARQALYVSADNLYFLEHRLLDLVDRLYKETDTRLLCIDEIHKYTNWEQELKNITDTYLDFQIIFTGSSTIDLIHGKYDLSRRVTLYPLYGLSFREYLALTFDENYPKLTLRDIIDDHQTTTDNISLPKILKYFHDYLRIGYYPFFSGFTQEIEKFQAVENIAQKTIYEDIGTLHALKSNTLHVIENLYKFVLNSAPGELSAYKLANSLKKDFSSVSHYLNYLMQAGLIRFVYPKKMGQAYLRTPSKIYPENSNMLYASFLPTTQDTMLGKVRETFFVNQCQNAQIRIFYTDQGDFKIDDMTFEIGGKNKTKKQIKTVANSYILADGILTGGKHKIPLFLFGFLY